MIEENIHRDKMYEVTFYISNLSLTCLLSANLHQNGDTTQVSYPKQNVVSKSINTNLTSTTFTNY